MSAANRFKKRHSVYVIMSQGCYKIGRSQDIKTRISSMQCLSPTPVELVHFWDVGRYDDACLFEKEMHKACAGSRRKGEWFDLEEEDLNQLVQIRVCDVIVSPQEIEKPAKLAEEHLQFLDNHEMGYGGFDGREPLEEAFGLEWWDAHEIVNYWRATYADRLPATT